MDEFKDTIDFDYWLFGHYHDDRSVNNKSDMLCVDIKELNCYKRS